MPIVGGIDEASSSIELNSNLFSRLDYPGGSNSFGSKGINYGGELKLYGNYTRSFNVAAGNDDFDLTIKYPTSGGLIWFFSSISSVQCNLSFFSNTGLINHYYTRSFNNNQFIVRVLLLNPLAANTNFNVRVDYLSLGGQG